MIDLSFLPAVNAGLNALATVMLVAGLVLIKRKQITAHRNAMTGAFAISIVFLVSYVTHYIWRAQVAGGVHTAYEREGWLADFYYTMLFSHILLAMVVPVIAVGLLYLAYRQRFDAHRRLGRIGWPIWFYVSVTGVAIYFMLYHFNA